MELTLESYEMRVREYHRVTIETCHDDRFVKDIIEEWFTVIAPARAYEYGVHGMNRFGSRGVMAQIINCYMRWQRFKDLEFQVDWTDTLRDMWGYGVIMGIVTDVEPRLLSWSWIWDNTREPDQLFEDLIAEVWEGEPQDISGVTSSAIALPVATWKQFWREWDGQS